MKYCGILLALFVVLAPSEAEAQCHYCDEGRTFHWLVEDERLFEGIYPGHGIMIGGCESHTHNLVCCWAPDAAYEDSPCAQITEEEKAIYLAVVKGEEVNPADVFTLLALSVKLPDRFQFDMPANVAEDYPTLTVAESECSPEQSYTVAYRRVQ